MSHDHGQAQAHAHAHAAPAATVSNPMRPSITQIVGSLAFLGAVIGFCMWASGNPSGLIIMAVMLVVAIAYFLMDYRPEPGLGHPEAGQAQADHHGHGGHH